MEAGSEILLSEPDKEDLKCVIQGIRWHEGRSWDSESFYRNFNKSQLLRAQKLISYKLCCGFEHSFKKLWQQTIEFFDLLQKEGELPRFLIAFESTDSATQFKLIKGNLLKLDAMIAELLTVYEMGAAEDLEKPSAPLVSVEQMQLALKNQLRYANCTLGEELSLKQEADNLCAELTEKWREYERRYQIYRAAYFNETAEGKYRNIFAYSLYD